MAPVKMGRIEPLIEHPITSSPKTASPLESLRMGDRSLIRLPIVKTSVVTVL
jgi:hypothetical protein